MPLLTAIDPKLPLITSRARLKASSPLILEILVFLVKRTCSYHSAQKKPNGKSAVTNVKLWDYTQLAIAQPYQKFLDWKSSYA